MACKDWLTNKVDRSVTGKVARQQCQGEIQLPLSDLGAVALDYRGKAGIATSIGHAPQVALVDPAAGSVMAIAEQDQHRSSRLLPTSLRVYPQVPTGCGRAATKAKLMPACCG